MTEVNGSEQPITEARRTQIVVEELANLVAHSVGQLSTSKFALLLAMTTVQARELAVLRQALVDTWAVLEGDKDQAAMKLCSDELHRRMRDSCQRAIDEIKRPKIQVARGVVRPDA